MDNPYTAPSAPAPPAPGTFAPPQRPGAIPVLGIIDLVFAGIGILTTTYSISTYFPSQAAPAPPHEWQDTGILVISTVVTALLLIAGLKLVRGSRSALAASNRYAVASIGEKFIYVAQAVHGISSPGFHNLNHARLLTAFSVMITLSGVIYPMLCLLLLNRRVVKDWLAVYGR